MSVQIDYPLGLTGLNISATAYPQATGDVSGIALTFSENTHRLGYYSATSSNLTVGVHWFQISVAGINFDSMWQTIPVGGTVVLVPSQFEGSYLSPPTANAIAAATANVLFVDGATNSLKVNADHSVSAGAGPVTIQNNITVPAAVAVASQVPNFITCLRGDTLRVSLPPMGDLTTRTKLVMTAKACVSDSDELAVLQIIEHVGLARLNGSNSVVPETASLLVSNATTGVVNLEIDASATALLAIRDLVWDAQAYLSSGIVSPISGILAVVPDVTRAVT